MKKHFILSVITVLFAFGKTHAQTYVPVATTGYTLDGVAENTTAIATTGGAMDDNFFALYSQYYGTLYGNGAVGLPDNGTIVSGTRTYQLQNYTAPNVLHIQANLKDSLTFVTPQAFLNISLLSFATQGAGTVSITVRFTDNTTQVFSGVSIADWFTANTAIASGFDRVLRTTGVPAYVGSVGNPRMFGTDLAIACANQGKPIKRVVIQNTSAAHVCIMAVSGNNPPYSVTANTSICSGANVTITGSGLTSYTWAPVGSFAGSNSGTITVSPSSTTTYTLNGDNAGCPGYTVITINVSSGQPTLSLAGSTQTVCLGAAATITASGAINYTLTSPAVNGGTFAPSATAGYTITGANGCGTGSITTTITVSPLAVTAAASPTLVCAGSPATLSAGGATTYTWMPGSSSQTNYIISPTANTIYTLTGKTGNCLGTNTVAIATKPLPGISIIPSSTAICNGNSANLSVTGNALTYTWSVNNQTITSISVSPTITSVYSVIGTNSVNCTSTVQQILSVKPNPTVTATASNPLVCAGGPSTLIAAGATTYVWDASANSVTGNTAVVTPTSDITYVVTGSYSTGCNASATVIVTIFSPGVAVSGDTFVCLGSNVNISGDGASTYTWVNTGVASQGINVSPAATTIYTVNATISDINTGVTCDASNTLQVTVNPNPTVTVSSNRTDNSICRGGSATLTAAGATTYTWTGGSGVVLTSTTVVTPILDQSYSVTGTDANGCKSSDHITIKVVTCTGIKTNAVSSNRLSIYPNPSGGVVNITAETATDLVISNELGQLVSSVKLNAANNYHALLDGLSPGVYFVTDMTGGTGVKQKLVITK